MSYLYLAIAIVAEVIGTTALKSSEGFTRLGPSLVVAAGYLVAFVCLSLVLDTIPVGEGPAGLAVSPDGTQVAFISKRGGAWGLWVMPVAGGEATQVTAIEGELPDCLAQAVDWAR